MSVPKLIGLNGFKGSGKNTAADLLTELVATREERVKGVGFADNLKVLAALCFGIVDSPDDREAAIAAMDKLKAEHPANCAVAAWRDEASFVGEYTDFHEVTGRQFLQNLGNFAREVLGDTLWIDAVLPLGDRRNCNVVNAAPWPYWWDTFTDSGVVADWCCMTDLRYPNEAERVLALGGEVWEIVRPGCESDGHATETPLPPELITVSISNSGDLDDFKAMLQQVSQAYGHRGALPHP